MDTTKLTTNRMPNRGLMLLALAAGAGIAYFADPDRGAERRAKLRDQATSALRSGRETLGQLRSDFQDRANDVDGGYADVLGGSAVRSETGRLAPAPRFLAGSIGSALMALGLLRRGRTIPAALVGAGMLAQAVANRPRTRNVGRD
jgi:hypothetical protein